MKHLGKYFRKLGTNTGQYKLVFNLISQVNKNEDHKSQTSILESLVSQMGGHQNYKLVVLVQHLVSREGGLVNLRLVG